jgi:hypothetical protein
MQTQNLPDKENWHRMHSNLKVFYHPAHSPTGFTEGLPKHMDSSPEKFSKSHKRFKIPLGTNKIGYEPWYEYVGRHMTIPEDGTWTEAYPLQATPRGTKKAKYTSTSLTKNS